MTNNPPTRPDSRNKIYDVIDGEIDYAVTTHPQSPALTLTDYVGLIDHYAVKLATPFAHESPTPPALSINEEAQRAKVALGIVREIAALSVRAMAAYSAIPRENHVPASAGITGTMHAVVGPDKLTPAPAAHEHPEHK